mmetsp:Transcript_18710/g.71137  ORF Transcript_18710/g.71137 Transcript_18710/m.71137 type:complete len:296 (-) Transcript_18710:353-1240(-)
MGRRWRSGVRSDAGCGTEVRRFRLHGPNAPLRRPDAPRVLAPPGSRAARRRGVGVSLVGLWGRVGRLRVNVAAGRGHADGPGGRSARRCRGRLRCRGGGFCHGLHGGREVALRVHGRRRLEGSGLRGHDHLVSELVRLVVWRRQEMVRVRVGVGVGVQALVLLQRRRGAAVRHESGVGGQGRRGVGCAHGRDRAGARRQHARRGLARGGGHARREGRRGVARRDAGHGGPAEHDVRGGVGRDERGGRAAARRAGGELHGRGRGVGRGGGRGSGRVGRGHHHGGAEREGRPAGQHG